MSKLLEAIAKLNEEKGGAVGSVLDIPRGHGNIPTGLIELDRHIRGGVPRGKLTQIYGENNCGKSTLVMGIAREAQAQGLNVAYIDPERTFDPEYARAIGIDIDTPGRFVAAAPDDGIDAIDIMEALVDTGEIGLLVLDSVTFMVPRAMLEMDPQKNLPAVQARQNSMMVRRLIGRIANTNTAFVVINHLAGTMQTSQKTGQAIKKPGGGDMLQNASSLKLLLRKKEWPIGPDGKPVTNLNLSTHSETTIRVEKNKIGRQYLDIDARLEFGHGFDRVYDAVSALGSLTDELGKEAVSKLPIYASGSWYYADGRKWNGKEKFIADLHREPELFDAVVRSVRAGFGL